MIKGNQLYEQILALNSGTDLSQAIFEYLEAHEVNWDPKLMKSLDSEHSEIDKKIVTSLDRVEFFGKAFGTPNENEHMIIFALRLYEGDATNVDPEQQAYTPGISDALAQNGEFDITINGVIQMTEKPNLDFTTAEEEPYSGWIVLPKPLIWIAQTPLKWEMIFPNAPTTVNLAIAAELNGWKLIS